MRRAYKLPDGTRVPGSTTVIGRFKESGGLIWWACSQGQKNPNVDVREALYGEKAAEIGTFVHGMVEAHIKGQKLPDFKLLPPNMHEPIQSGFDAYLQWERMTKLEITHQEIMLVSPEYQFGGRPDAIGLIEGEPCLIDWKTSKAVYPDMLVQLASYGYLVEHGLQQEKEYEPLAIQVKGFHLCKFSKEHGDFSHHYFPNLDEAWEQFKRFRQAWDTDKILKARAA